MDIYCFLYESLESSERQSMSYAMRRIAGIKELVGEAAVGKVIENVRAEERRNLGWENWRVFTQGEMWEWKKVQHGFWEQLAYLRARLRDEDACRAAFAFLKDHPSDLHFGEGGDLWYLSEPFAEDDSAPCQLVMSVRSRSGARREAEDYRVDCPVRWTAPSRPRFLAARQDTISSTAEEPPRSGVRQCDSERRATH